MKNPDRSSRLQRIWRHLFARRRERHDRLLVMAISSFNFDGGWHRLLYEPKAHENGRA